VAIVLAAACLAGATVAVGTLWALTRPGEVAVSSVIGDATPTATLAATGGSLPVATLVVVEVVRADQRTRSTAVWLDEQGAALVPAPVVEGADQILVRLEGAPQPARLTGTDPTTALAVVRTDAVPPRARGLASTTAPATAGDEVGVHRIGATAAGLVVDDALVQRSGVRSTVDGQVVHDTIHLDRMLAADALGALVLDAEGGAVGLVVDTGSRGSPAVAIPAATALAVGADLNANGEVRRAWLGVRATDGADGATLTSVQAGSPADAAGLLAGDLIVEVDGVPVVDASDLVIAIKGWRPGERVLVSWRRDGTSASTEVILGG
jgi:S1-C subfamily serine protease